MMCVRFGLTAYLARGAVQFAPGNRFLDQIVRVWWLSWDAVLFELSFQGLFSVNGFAHALLGGSDLESLDCVFRKTQQFWSFRLCVLLISLRHGHSK